jgi:hypothetical protein
LADVFHWSETRIGIVRPMATALRIRLLLDVVIEADVDERVARCALGRKLVWKFVDMPHPITGLEEATVRDR